MGGSRLIRRPGRLVFHPATPERWPDVEALFGERGACAGCWCMYWRLRRADWEVGKGAGNRRVFRGIVLGGGTPGVIAYLDGAPVGWCAVAPREDYPALERSRILAPVDERPVWSISCLFIERRWRRQGIATALLKAACDHARGLGARIVEGYPVEPDKDRAPDAFLWTGTASAFLRAGFREVARRSRTRPIMRRRLNPPGSAPAGSRRRPRAAPRA